MEFGQPTPIENDLPSCWGEVTKDLISGVDPEKPFYDIYREIIGLASKLIVIKNLNEGNVDVTIEDSLKQIAEIGIKRNEFGIKKYGIPLQPMNGRDCLSDCVEEVLDLLVYFKQFQLEQELSRASN